MATPCELKSMYERGDNIIAYLRQEKGIEGNTEEMIEVGQDTGISGSFKSNILMCLRE